MRRRIAIGSLSALVLLLVAALVLLWYVTSTESGLRFALARLPHRVGTITLDVQGVRGTLAHGVEIARVEIDHKRSHLVFEGVSARLALRSLFWQTIDIEELSVRSATIQVRRRTEPLKNWKPHFLPRFLTIRSDHIRAGHVLVVAPSGRRNEFDRIVAAGAAHQMDIRIFDSAFDFLGMRVTASGEVRAADPMQLEGSGRIVWELPKQPRWIAYANVEGDLNRLGLTGRIETPFRAGFDGALAQLTSTWNYAGKATIQEFDLRAWGGGGALGRITGTLDIAGDAKGFRARGPLDSAGLAAGLFDLDFEGSYADKVVTASRVRLAHRSSRTTTTLDGTIGIVENGPQLALAGTWQDFRWPLVGDEIAVRSTAGKYRLDGVWPFALEASGTVQPADLPVMPVSVRGALASDHLDVREGSVQAFGGSSSFTSLVRWSPAEAWSVAGKATGIDPAQLRPGFPGSLRFEYRASGNALGEETDLDVTVNDLSGRVRGTAARGSGRFVRTGDTWRFDTVRAQSGNSRLALDGQIGRTVDLRFDVRTEDLALLAPESRGEITAKGEIRGTPDEPIVKLAANGRRIRHEGVGIGTLAADVDFDPRAGHASKSVVRLQDVAFGERKVDAVDLTLDGSTDDLKLALTAAAAPTSIRVAANGPLAAGTWRAMLRSLAVDEGERLHLKLAEPAPLQIAKSGVEAGRVCLRGETANVCGEGRWRPEGWQASLSADHLPLSSLTAGLAQRVHYEGTLGVAARLHGTGGAPWQGSIRADLADAAVRHRLVSGREDVIRLGSGRFTTEASAQMFASELDLDAGETGTIRGALTAQRHGGDGRELDFAQMPIRGELRAVTAALGFVSLYVPEIDRSEGKLDADLVIGGTLGKPSLSGILRLANGELDLYQVNLALRQIALEARFIDNRLDFKGSAHAGDGNASVDGSIAWRDSHPTGVLHLKGEELRLVNVPEARVLASPDLTFHIDDRRIDVSGRVAVPYARLIPADLAGAVLPSGDEVIVGEQAPKTTERYVLTSDVTMTLGDRVTIDTLGLTGRLTGSVNVATTADGLSRGRGELNVAEGKYAAYGRKLDIERGRLIFSGGLVGDPGIDLRAIKEFPDVKAGVNVRGTLRSPRMTFFSEPSIPQSQILSLILAGGTLESVQRTDRNGNGTARSELLAQGGAIIAQQLGAKVGIEDVSIEQDLSNDTSLVLGKYLSPRLYVSYGISLTEAINTIKMRYTLGDRWTIRTEAGQERSADLVYTIEK